MNKPFLYKVVRCDAEGCSRRDWRHMLMAMTKSKETVALTHRNPRSSKKKLPWGIRINGVYQVGVDKLYPKQMKMWHSKHTSFSYADPTQDYLPPAFGIHDAGRAQQLTGFMIPTIEKNVLLQRITQYDRSTYERSYLYHTKQDAEHALKQRLEDKQEFTTLDELAAAKVTNAHNEVMARARWDQDCRLLIFSDNLAMRILTQIRAINVSNRLIQCYKEDGIAIPEQKPEVAIGFYASEASKLKEYSKEDQESDLKEAIGSSDITIKRYAQFHLLLSQEFHINEAETKVYSWEDIKEFITLATNLTFESSVLFYKNFFLKHYKYLVSQIPEAAVHNTLVDLFMCVPPSLRFELIATQITDPKHRTIYLFSLMQRENFELDDKEIMAILNSDWEFDIDYLDSNGKSFFDITLRNKFFMAVKTLIAKKHKKHGGELRKLELEAQREIAKVFYEKINAGEDDDLAPFLAYDPSLLFQNDAEGNTPLHHAISAENGSAIKSILSYAGNRAVQLKQIKNNKGHDYYNHISAQLYYRLHHSTLRTQVAVDLLDLEENLPSFLPWKDANERQRNHFRMMTLISFLLRNNRAEAYNLTYEIMSLSIRKEISNELYTNIMKVLEFLNIHGLKFSLSLLTTIIEKNDTYQHSMFDLLLCAIETKDLELTRKLLESNHGLLYACDAVGHTLLDYATFWDTPPIIELLQQLDVGKTLKSSAASIASLTKKILAESIALGRNSQILYAMDYAGRNNIAIKQATGKILLLQNISVLVTEQFHDHKITQKIIDKIKDLHETRIEDIHSILAALHKRKENFDKQFLDSLVHYLSSIYTTYAEARFKILYPLIEKNDIIKIEAILEVDPSAASLDCCYGNLFFEAASNGRIKILKLIEQTILKSKGTAEQIFKFKTTPRGNTRQNFYDYFASHLEKLLSSNTPITEEMLADINEWFAHEATLPKFLTHGTTATTICTLLFWLHKINVIEYVQRFKALPQAKQEPLYLIFRKFSHDTSLVTQEICAGLFTSKLADLQMMQNESYQNITVRFATPSGPIVSTVTAGPTSPAIPTPSPKVAAIPTIVKSTANFTKSDVSTMIHEYLKKHLIELSQQNIINIAVFEADYPQSLLKIHAQTWQHYEVTSPRCNTFYEKLRELTHADWGYLEILMKHRVMKFCEFESFITLMMSREFCKTLVMLEKYKIEFTAALMQRLIQEFVNPDPDAMQLHQQIKHAVEYLDWRSSNRDRYQGEKGVVDMRYYLKTITSQHQSSLKEETDKMLSGGRSGNHQYTTSIIRKAHSRYEFFKNESKIDPKIKQAHESAPTGILGLPMTILKGLFRRNQEPERSVTVSGSNRTRL